MSLSGENILAGYYQQQSSSGPRPAVQVSLTSWTGYADTGQEISIQSEVDVPTPSVYLDKPCCLMHPQSIYQIPYAFHVRGRNDSMTLTGWAALQDIPSGTPEAPLFSIGRLRSGLNGAWDGIFVLKVNSTTSIGGALLRSGSIQGTPRYAAHDLNWHFFAMTLEVDSTSICTIYVDGVLKGTASADMKNREMDRLLFGDMPGYAGASTYSYYLRDVRGYESALTADQIQDIYEEGL